MNPGLAFGYGRNSVIPGKTRVVVKINKESSIYSDSLI